MKREYIAIALLAALIGFLAQFQWVGSLLIGIFGAISLWKRIPSRLLFLLGLFSLILVPVAIILGRWAVAQNFGAYGFLLFVVGMIVLTAELRRSVAVK